MKVDMETIKKSNTKKETNTWREEQMSSVMKEKSATNKTRNTREISFDMISRVLENGELSHIVMREGLAVFGNSQQDNMDKSFISRLVLGTIERKITLDYVIDSFSKTKTAKMKPLIRTLLRMSVYQILYMEQVPDSAACNEAVKLAKRHRFHQLAPFVNGVLRTISREKENIRYPSREKDLLKALEVEFSVPEWIIRLMMEKYGKEKTFHMLSCLYQKEDGVSLRINTSKTCKKEVVESLQKENVKVCDINLVDNMIRINDFGFIGKLSVFKKGFVQVQDPSSVLAVLISGAKEGDFCMDLCAAPGGKTMHLADLLKGNGKIIARDLTENKIKYINENVKRCGFDNVITEVYDSSILDERYVGMADVVIVDAPCSGLGVIGRKSDIKYRLKKEDIKALSEISKSILRCAATYLKTGGYLIFSTCTLTKEENEDNRQWMMDNFPLKPVDIRMDLSDELLKYSDNPKTAKDGYLSLLITEQTDGFFISKFQKM